MEYVYHREQGNVSINYFDRTNEAMKPFIEYDGKYVLYNIDIKNRVAGIELYLDHIETIKEVENLLHTALTTAFDKYGLNKIYVNVIRDNYSMFAILDSFNFVTEAIHRGQYFDSTTHDVIYMTVMKNEWLLGGITLNYRYSGYAVKFKQP